MATQVVSGTIRTNLGPLTTNTRSYPCTEVIGGFSAFQAPNRYQTFVQLNPTTIFLVGSCGTDGPTYTPFSVVYQASDIPGESTTPGSTSSDSSQPSPTSQPNNPSPETSKSTGLSPGAKAGIAIGAILGTIFIATAAFCLWRARRRRRASPSQDAEYAPPEFRPFAPVGATYVHSNNNITMGVAQPSGLVEVNPDRPAELTGRSRTIELGPLYRNEIART
ncbi:hypothetical protein F5Y01DRAFT_318288 [Xylaria sp. FL0043]|nr:hypothetical protein F5Y01DRAFT_318288 [Xylaria sp. FL0043]